MNRSVVNECKKVNNISVLDPDLIDNPSVYSILTNKYYKAEQENININIEIMHTFSEIKKYSYEFCRVLSILLDNAIEAAKECEEKNINIRYIKEKNFKRKVLIIENTYKEKDVDLEKIFEKGFSTKNYQKEEHGLGLWNVKKILKRIQNFKLYTTKGEYFSQRLEIY